MCGVTNVGGAECGDASLVTAAEGKELIAMTSGSMKAAGAVTAEA